MNWAAMGYNSVAMTGRRTMAEAGITRMVEIRAASLQEFTSRGYEATTMGDIAARIGIRGPSLYKHVASKQELLVAIMSGTMEALISAQRSAVATTTDPTERLRRAVQAHVRFHVRHQLEAFVGNREIRSVTQPHRRAILARRAEYELGFRSLITDGLETGVFRTTSPQLASYAILDMGIGVSAWFRNDRGLSEDEVVWQQTEFALRILGAG